MKRSWVLIPLLFVAWVGVNADEELELAEICDEEKCKAPDCRCSSENIPSGFAVRNTPQFVMVTFDDAVNIINIETYRDTLYKRKNTNGCNAGATFYVSHEYSNYQLINELYNNGFEIALHSISHQTPQTYWQTANATTMRREFADQRVLMSHFANIPIDAIQGIRMPFLQYGGNSSFQVMKEIGMTYDCSWTTVSFANPGLWPYTLDYASSQDCPIPPCPTASIPGQWVQPMITWRDLNDDPCAMADACFTPPSLTDENAWFNFIITNFERHYFTNRSPFGIYLHEWFIRANPAVNKALIRFLDTINNIPDVFMVNTIDVINWVKDPVPVNEYKQKQCPRHVPSSCSARNCGPLVAPHKDESYWMSICGACPKVYPWLDNPLGL